jgi:hypothetical protein
MRTRFSAPLALFLALAILLSSFAASSMAAKSVSLLEVRYVDGVGVVFLFDTAGLKNADIKKGAYIIFRSTYYDLACDFKDDETTVRCVVRGGLTEWAGDPVCGELAGFPFCGTMPARRVAELVCEEGTELWYLIVTLVEGVPVDVFPVRAVDFYEFILPMLNDEGMDYQILDAACLPIDGGN